MSKTPKEPQPKRKKKRVRRRSAKPDTQNSASGWQVRFDVPRPPAFQPAAPDLWRTTMLDLRQQFQRKRDEDGALRCQLVQSSTADKEHLAVLNRKQTGDSFVSCEAGEYFGFRVYRDAEHKLVYTDVPTLDVEGKPIVDGAGRAILCDMPTGREVFVFGAPGKGLGMGTLFESAGGCLRSAPPDAISWIPQDTLFTRDDKKRWLWTMFELAWRELHPALRAERITWFSGMNDAGKPAPFYIAYDREKIAAIRATLPMGRYIPEAWTKRLPSYFRSELPDLFAASVSTIDYLLSRRVNEDPKQSPGAEDRVTQAPKQARSKVGAMNQFDRHVLCTIARLARGITIEIPPTRKEPISEKLRELPGTLIWRNRVPELFLTLEYRKSPDQEQLAGAVVSMHGRGLIVSFRDRLLLPDEECRYQCLTGLRSLPDVCRQRLRPLARRETTDRSQRK